MPIGSGIASSIGGGSSEGDVGIIEDWEEALGFSLLRTSFSESRNVTWNTPLDIPSAMAC